MSRLAALVLAAVFVVAGGAKLVRRPDVRGLGLPAQTPTVVAAVELALAAVLVLAPANGGIAALVLLAGFTAFLAASMGKDAGCGCFGSTTATSVRPRDLVRNLVLLAVAAVAAFG